MLHEIQLPTLNGGPTHAEKEGHVLVTFYAALAQQKGLEIKNPGQVLRALKNTPEQARAFFKEWVRRRYPMTRIDKKLLEDACQRFMREQYAPEKKPELVRRA